MSSQLKLPMDEPVYYIIVARAILGCAAHTAGEPALFENQKDLRDGASVYNPAGDNHAGGVHSLIVEFGNQVNQVRTSMPPQQIRLREFVFPSEGQLLPLFLVAYKRDPRPPTGAYGALDCK